MNDPEASQIFNHIHNRNKEEDEMRYKFAKEIVKGTVE
jgi:hypothetical protein